MSKCYGESERLLAKVFSLANELPSGAIIFLDEVHSYFHMESSDKHEKVELAATSICGGN